jgi:predicted metal-binding membrane protein
MPDESMLESLLSHPNRLIGATLLILIGLAWLLLFNGGPVVLSMQHVHSPAVQLRNFGILVLMWLLMAVAMMLPTAAPAILSFADIARAGHQTGAGRPAAFVLGYLSAWSGFGVLAAATQWGLGAAALYISALNVQRPPVLGAVLICAGLYQFSALKKACLTQCRSPLAFFLAHWRDGAHGALYLGFRHGTYCVGCCWALMALMLFAGTMSIAWTIGLAGVMLAEKIAPAGRTITRAIGMALFVCGGVLIASGLIRGQIP